MGGGVTEKLTGGSRTLETQVRNGIPATEKSRWDPTRRLRRPPGMGDMASPLFASLYLWADAKAPSLLLPLEALALPSPSHFPAPLFLGHALSTPKQSPLNFTCASGTAVLPLARPFSRLARPRAGEGRENPWPGPRRLRALANQNLSGGAEKKTRSSDQPRDPRGTGTIGKPGADYPSGRDPCLLLLPPLLPRAPLNLQ